MKLESLANALLLVACTALSAACSRDAAPGPAPAPARGAAAQAVLGSGLLPLDPQGRPSLPEAEFEIQGAPKEYRQRAEFHDFGFVPFGETVEHTWTLENTDDVAIEIVKLSPSCGCVSARVRHLDATGAAIGDLFNAESGSVKIAPRARIQLVVRIDTREIQVKNQDKLAWIRIVTSSPNRPYLVIEAHIVADSPLQPNPEALELGRVPASVGATAKVDLLPVGPSGTLPLELGPVPAGYEASLEHRDVLGRDLWTLKLVALPPVAPGPLRGELEVRTQRPTQPPLPGQRVYGDDRLEWVPGRPFLVRFQGQGIGDLDVFPVQLVANGTRAAGGRGEVTLSSLLAGQRLRVTGSKLVLPGGIATHGELAVHATPIDADDSGRAAQWRLELVAPPDFAPEQLAGTAVIELDDLQFPRHEVPFLVRLQ